MGWTNDQVNEIVAPASTPFLPGNDVIGFGTALPPELAAYAPFSGGAHIQTAIVFYNSAFNPTSTAPQIKFHFMGPAVDPVNGGVLCIGMGICNNPSLSTVAVCIAGQLIGANNAFSGHMTSSYQFRNHLDNEIIVLEEYTNAGDASINTLNGAGNTVTGQLPAGT